MLRLWLWTCFETFYWHLHRKSVCVCVCMCTQENFPFLWWIQNHGYKMASHLPRKPSVGMVLSSYVQSRHVLRFYLYCHNSFTWFDIIGISIGVGIRFTEIIYVVIYAFHTVTDLMKLSFWPQILACCVGWFARNRPITLLVNIQWTVQACNYILLDECQHIGVGDSYFGSTLLTWFHLEGNIVSYFEILCSWFML